MKKFTILSLMLLFAVFNANIFAATYTVINTNDSGAGSLRQAILDSNGSIGFDTIDFSIPGSVPFTIQPTSALPNINDNWDSGTFIDAGTQDIIIDGTNAGAVTTGLHISSDNNVISGLVINNFGGNGIFIDSCNNNLIVNNYIGTDVTGTVDMGNSLHGVCITNGAQSNTIGGTITGTGNIISGNNQNGVYLSGSGTDNNVILGNFIGTNVTGTVDLGNSSSGVYIANSASSNTIGGIVAGAKNVISGNNDRGIYMINSGTDNNVIIGNFIGTNLTGTGAIGNTNQGIYITNGPQSNIIGGTTAGERNIVSCNFGGVFISGSGTDNNEVIGNYIGTDVNGTSDLGNASDGVIITNSAQGNTIGGTIAGSGNVISGNNQSGIFLTGSATNNKIIGNYIGTDCNGTADLGNSQQGIEITGSAQSNTIGGTIAGTRNIISGNDQNGIYIYNSGTDNNVILGNYIGTDVTGTVDLGNSWYGIRIWDGPQSNIIGGTVAGARNIISGNNNCGIEIYGSGTDNNQVLGNYIGTDVNGTADLGNSSFGIYINGGAQSNIIGGTIAGARNIISGNNQVGIVIWGSGTDNNIIIGNYIGTDVNGTADLGNGWSGVFIASGATSNTIGGTVAGTRNIISGNDQYGINITDLGTDNNRVLGNYIGTDVNGTADLGNTINGISITGGALSNTIGGTVAGARNIISGNNGGINIYGIGTDNNKVLGNYIGTDVNGTSDLGNASHGVIITDSAQGNTIGGTIPGSGNVISGNNNNGVYLSGSGTDNNVIIGNYIGTNLTGTGAIGNTNQGIYINAGPQSNRIGGTTVGERNIISGNLGGILISGSGSDNNIVMGNHIGTNAAGDAALGNTQNGVYILSGAKSNTIGGTDAGTRNIISGNDENGVIIDDSGTDNNVVLGNYIGTDVNGTAGLGNSFIGVYICSGAKSNIIGGTVDGARNIISGNNLYGVYIEGAGTSNNIITGNYIGTNASGTGDLGNSWDGIVSSGNSNTIGGTVAGARNIISGNNWSGVSIISTDNKVIGNYIGTDVTGTLDLGNSRNGIQVEGSSAKSNTIGGTIAGMANIIAYNGQDGVWVHGDNNDYNRISGNSIFSNAGLGIDLAADGVNPNDAGDVDTGPNENLNFPVITDIVQTGVDTYTVNGTAAANIEVELYIVNNSTAGVNADPTGYGEGYEYYTTQNTDGSGNFSFTEIDLSADAVLSSIAIDATSNTSEFGENIAISSNTVTVSISDDAPASEMQGTADVLMSNFTLSADADNAFWTDITVEGNGTNVDSDVSSIKIYADNGNSTYSSAEDTLLGSGTFASGLVDINITDQNIITTSSVYFIVIDLNPAAAIGNTFTISISDSSNFTIMSPDQMAVFTPYLSASVIVTDAPDPITVLPADLAVAAAKAGTRDQVFEQLTLSTSNESATLSIIKADLIGTADDNDVSAAKVYLDNGDDSFSVADDTLIGTGTFTSGTTDINIADQIIGTTAKKYFVCLDISADAVNGHTIGISCADTTYFTVISPDTVSEANIPFESGLTLIKSYADTLDDILIYPNPWNKDLSGDHITFSRLTEDVTIRIYTVAGELVLETDADGQSEWEWDLANEDGESVAVGIYICHISNDADAIKVVKVAIIK
ncbi:S-layer family protein [bacterium]|nr:S-layer family protein [bacterium]